MNDLGRATEELMWGETHEWPIARTPDDVTDESTVRIAVDVQTPAEKRVLFQQWHDFFLSGKGSITELEVFNVTQELFDAICEHRTLKRLFINGGRYENISKITQLENLETLYLEGGSRTRSLDPLMNLRRLRKLSLVDFHDIVDYSALGDIKNLETLVLMAHPFHNKYIHINTLDFLHKLSGLRSLVVMVARIGGDNYEPVLALRNLEYLVLGGKRRLDKVRDKIELMPSLKMKYLDEK